jgi:hypothetical protein
MDTNNIEADEDGGAKTGACEGITNNVLYNKIRLNKNNNRQSRSVTVNSSFRSRSKR